MKSPGAAGIPSGWRRWMASLGPGLVAGGANNDPACVTTFAVSGALTGFSQLWILVLTTPMLIAVQTICGTIGVETRRGLATLLRIRFGTAVSVGLTTAFVAGNFTAMIADVLILSDTMNLLTGLPAWYFPVLVVFLTWHILVFHNFRRLIGTLAFFSSGFLVYVAAAFMLHPGWRHVLAGTLWPHWSSPLATRREFLASAAALLGARLSPYLFYWEASAETEQFTDVRLRDQTKFDITVGMVTSNLICYFITVTTAATLAVQHLRIDTMREAVRALQPVAGPAATWLYAMGIVGSGLIALPVMAATSSYAVAETMAWRSGLEKRPWQAQRFYVVLSAALLLVALLSYLPWNTVRLAIFSQICWGALAPVILGLVFFLERRRNPARRMHVTRWQRGWLLAAVILGAAILVAGVWS